MKNKILSSLFIGGVLLVSTYQSEARAGTPLTTKEQCSTRDLRNDPRLPPAKSQGRNAWCFAYAMATITSFALNEPVSAVGFIMAPTWSRGLNRNETLKQTLKETDMPQMFRETQNWGFCREKDLPSEIAHDEIEDLPDAYDMIKRERMQTTCDYFEGLENGDRERNIKLAFPMASLSDIIQASTGITAKDAELFQLGEKSCKQHRFTPAKKLQFRWLGGNDKGSSGLNELLDQNRPVGVNYSAKPVLKTPKDFGHASTIIGRQWNNGACEFLIRDPYGSKTTSTRPNRNGDIWVPETDLVKGRPGLWTIE